MQTATASMTAEHATMILRRRPQNAREAAVRREALRVLTLAGLGVDEIEMGGMTRLDHGDLAVIHEAAAGV